MLGRLDKHGILKEVVLVGSWCTLFYKDFFKGQAYRPVIATRDMDLLIPRPASIKGKVDIAQLLEDIGFIVGFTGSKGFIRLEHPGLIVEFLVPEKGKGSDNPYPLPQLGVNAQTLRFLEFLSARTINATVKGISITLPHPVNFALHKLILANRRPSKEKAAKDIQAAVWILHAIIRKKQTAMIRETYDSMPKRWKTMVIKTISQLDDPEIKAVFA